MVTSTIDTKVNYNRRSNAARSFLFPAIKSFCVGVGHDDQADELFDLLYSRYNVYEPVGGDDEFFGLLQEYYEKTVVPHKIAVYEEGMKIYKQFGLGKANVHRILMVHDLSKFSTSETGYAFIDFSDFKSNSPERIADFELSWHHHKMHNSHHPEHWHNVGKKGECEVMQMPVQYVAEMIADWMGAGKTYGSTLEEWLPKNIGNFVFHEKNAVLIAKIISDVTDLTLFSVEGKKGVLQVI